MGFLFIFLGGDPFKNIISWDNNPEREGRERKREKEAEREMKKTENEWEGRKREREGMGEMSFRR